MINPQQASIAGMHQATVPAIVFCANGELHYVVENQLKFYMPLYLAIKLKNHIKSVSHSDNLVSNWVKELPAEERFLINVATV